MTPTFHSLRPAGGFKVFLADPPWSFAAWSENGEEKGAASQYDCMTIEDIEAMPVATLAASDSVLFIWCTWPLMPHWNRVIEAWGFEFKGLAWEWVKYNKETDKYAFGLGYGTRKNLEPCLIATRGNPSMKTEINDMFGTITADGVRSVRDFIEWYPSDCIRAKRREHSRKPDEQYRRIETMFDGPYIELFARNERPGWTSWGNEVGKFAEAAE